MRALSSREANTHEFKAEQIEKAIANNELTIDQLVEVRSNRAKLQAQVKAAATKHGLIGGKQ